MQELFTPHFGLMLWTIVTFLALVFVLGRFGWGPLISGLEGREKFLAEQRKLAEEARKTAEELKALHEKQLGEAQRDIQAMVAQARKDGERTRSELLAAAKEESERLLEKGRKDLQGESERLRGALRGEVAELSVALAEKILKRAVDKKVQEDVLNESIASIKGGQS